MKKHRAGTNLTPGEMSLLQDMSKADGQSLAGMIRSLITQEASRRGLHAPRKKRLASKVFLADGTRLEFNGTILMAFHEGGAPKELAYEVGALIEDGEWLIMRDRWAPTYEHGRIRIEHCTMIVWGGREW